MYFQIKINNYEALKKAYNEAPKLVTEETAKSLGRIAEHIRRKAVEKAPVNKGRGGGDRGYGGNLRQSIRSRRIKNLGYIVSVGAEYGLYVDQGTQPYMIHPGKKGFLAFQKDGRWIFTRKPIRHPGIKATRFFSNAVEAGQQYADIEMKFALTRVLEKIANSKI